MGVEMGNDSSDRPKLPGENRNPSTFVACILREVDTANAYIVELRDAISVRDRRRIATLKTELNQTWSSAQGAIANLERISGKHEVVARAALHQSQESARTTFAELWKLVTGSNS
jgi:hypothetical protein